ncbi:hypothetical protein HYW83_04200 [Candidatus Peregrinibacteria bacterium]|nr:hypothetical protein [Candidatus Peregrinibacteria bacterium]
MGDFEFFNPSEGGESYDPKAFERFKEQVKKNAAFIAAARKGEQKQKQKEDRLAKILLKFIQTNQKSGILMLAAKLLQENIPASFILSIIILGNDEIRIELEKEVQAGMQQLEAGTQKPANAHKTEFSLMARFSDSSLPLKMKAEIDEWGRNIFESGSAVPFRILETALTQEGVIKQVVIDCAANVLDDYLAQNEMAHINYDTCFAFCELFMKSVMKRLQEQIQNQKELS